MIRILICKLLHREYREPTDDRHVEAAWFRKDLRCKKCGTEDSVVVWTNHSRRIGLSKTAGTMVDLAIIAGLLLLLLDNLR